MMTQFPRQSSTSMYRMYTIYFRIKGKYIVSDIYLIVAVKILKKHPFLARILEVITEIPAPIIWFHIKSNSFEENQLRDINVLYLWMKPIRYLNFR